MVNFNKLADRAKKAREIVDQQVDKHGGSQGLKDKVEKMRGVAMSEGTVSERAKAAAAVAREKPNPAAPSPAEDAAGPIGGGAAPPEPAKAAAQPSPKSSKPAVAAAGTGPPKAAAARSEPSKPAKPAESASTNGAAAGESQADGE